MPTCCKTLGGKAGKVGDVLSEHDVPICGGRFQDVGVRPPGEPSLGNGGHVDSSGTQRGGKGRRVHLIEEELQRFEAAEVSCRCKSILALISSG